MAVYRILNENLKLIFLCITTRKQFINNDNTYSTFEENISRIFQGSIIGYVFFNLSINDIFFLVEKAVIQNFADDNTLSMWNQTVSDLVL